ncbi:suppressor of fused domain protein [Pseudomonas sp. 21LCFQ010]|uniref:suppressor of fused domain protein n=1 Tax=Pseudomonas sp. 21LCFQ010 TaxID=2957506 RepID=UPI002096E710|nr:suppressor of fused domain protein [Pseudomonas sp. 21LCFQ010]MCO8164316.1 suppressor of fused domain protein [Pseudomonas sp. 21LCFQ010]
MKLFDRLRDALKKSPRQPAVPEPAAKATLQEPREAIRQAGHRHLDRHWQAVGNLEPDVIAYLISPGLTGGPAWPSTRQAYRVVRRGESVLLASDGLSDPFDDVEGGGNGFEMELFIETADLAAPFRGRAGEVDPLKGSWAFELLEHVAGTVADAGGISAQLEQYGALSLELPGVSQSRAIGEQLPGHFVTEDDCIGVLLGGVDPDFPTRLDDMPLSPVTLVPVVLITAAELEYIRAGGGQARNELVTRLQALGWQALTRLPREAVV